jgi:isopentenyl diphosphate isomerase/L-lactate dehydrogenase-like FMN-dependent dehydrogenase
MVERAAAARYEALVLTVDTAVLGRRERDVRRGFSLPPTIGPGTLLDGALHPGWTWAFVRSEPIRFANVAGRSVGDGASPVTLSDYINTQFDPALAWDDVDWLRSVWDGPLVLKGVQTVDDAVLAAERGVEAIGPPPSRWWRRSPTRSEAAARSSATAACAAAATSPRRSRPGRPRPWPGAPTSTGWARRASGVSTGSSAGCRPT